MILFLLSRLFTSNYHTRIIIIWIVIAYLHLTEILFIMGLVVRTVAPYWLIIALSTFSHLLFLLLIWLIILVVVLMIISLLFVFFISISLIIVYLLVLFLFLMVILCLILILMIILSLIIVLFLMIVLVLRMVFLLILVIILSIVLIIWNINILMIIESLLGNIFKGMITEWIGFSIEFTNILVETYIIGNLTFFDILVLVDNIEIVFTIF